MHMNSIECVSNINIDHLSDLEQSSNCLRDKRNRVFVLFNDCIQLSIIHAKAKFFVRLFCEKNEKCVRRCT